MSELKRTASHFFDDGSEAVLNIGVTTYDNGEKSIMISSEFGDSFVSIYSHEQLEILIKTLRSVGSQIF